MKIIRSSFPKSEVDDMITAHEKREADAAAGAAEENGEGEINNDAAKRRKTTRDL